VIIDRMAGEIQEGSEGLLFLPYLAGERTPYADADARGAFVGLSLRHTRAHMARAVMEGVTMSMKDCMELGRNLSLVTTLLHLSGGGARSNFWQQMAADVLGIEVARVGIDEGPAYGAAILAAVGCSFHKSVEEACNTLIHVKDVKAPQRQQSEVYQRLYGIYGPLYGELTGFYRRDADFIKHGIDAG
jgi:xylulokinase